MVIALVVALWTPALAQAPPDGAALELGVWTPRLEFASAVERAEWATRLAVVLARVTGLRFDARAFTEWSDLQAFLQAGRMDVLLADPTALLEQGGRWEILAVGSGPLGQTPPLAVLAPGAPQRGVNALEGRGVALTHATQAELRVLSNHAFEGELSVERFFGRVVWGRDHARVDAALRAGRAGCTIGYAEGASARGLHVVAELRPLPLPVLAGLRGAVSDDLMRTIRRAIAGEGLAIPRSGPLSRLRLPATDPIAPLRDAMALELGQRVVRHAVWSPAPVWRLDVREWPVQPRGRYPLERPPDPWRLPEFPASVPQRTPGEER